MRAVLTTRPQYNVAAPSGQPHAWGLPQMTEPYVRFTAELHLHIVHEEPDVFKAVVLIASWAASRRFSRYSVPTDGGLDPHDQRLHLVARLSARKWKRLKDSILACFKVQDGRMYLHDSWYELPVGSSRPWIPAGVRSDVMRRDRFTCVYCGSTDGPFDLDHVVPLAQGGAPVCTDNLACACVPCNRSKSAMTPAEWMGT